MPRCFFDRDSQHKFDYFRYTWTKGNISWRDSPVTPEWPTNKPFIPVKLADLPTYNHQFLSRVERGEFIQGGPLANKEVFQSKWFTRPNTTPYTGWLDLVMTLFAPLAITLSYTLDITYCIPIVYIGLLQLLFLL